VKVTGELVVLAWVDVELVAVVAALELLVVMSGGRIVTK
jgi:hypothetical protein